LIRISLRQYAVTQIEDVTLLTSPSEQIFDTRRQEFPGRKQQYWIQVSLQGDFGPQAAPCLLDGCAPIYADNRTARALLQLQ
jgi:hypothetical protein